MLGMWVVEPNWSLGAMRERLRLHTLIPLHVVLTSSLYMYGTDCLPEDFHYPFALDTFKSYFVNQSIDHHKHEFLTWNILYMTAPSAGQLFELFRLSNWLQVKKP
jgi:hypothetical protein